MIKRTIINATQHLATEEQRAAGVIDLDGATCERVKEYMTFDSIPDHEDLHYFAAAIIEEIVRFAKEHGLTPKSTCLMLGGAPFFMSALERACKSSDIDYVYAFSQRKSVEKQLPDGTVVKQNVFKHLGFV